jgi:hypothetical protein
VTVGTPLASMSAGLPVSSLKMTVSGIAAEPLSGSSRIWGMSVPTNVLFCTFWTADWIALAATSTRDKPSPAPSWGSKATTS